MPEKLADLKRLCALWQRRLRLQDWKITIAWAKKGELPGDECGSCEPDHRYKEAAITIARQSARHGGSMPPPSTEHLIVHEMLHIYIEGLALGSKEREIDIEEQVINSLTSAFLELAHPRKDK